MSLYLNVLFMLLLSIKTDFCWHMTDHSSLSQNKHNFLNNIFVASSPGLLKAFSLVPDGMLHVYVCITSFSGLVNTPHLLQLRDVTSDVWLLMQTTSDKLNSCFLPMMGIHHNKELFCWRQRLPEQLMKIESVQMIRRRRKDNHKTIFAHVNQQRVFISRLLNKEQDCSIKRTLF